MRIPLNPRCSLAEYASNGRTFEFPILKRCPRCRSSRVHRHGFFQRNCCDGFEWYKIPIRRYYCRLCGGTVSFILGEPADGIDYRPCYTGIHGGGVGRA